MKASNRLAWINVLAVVMVCGVVRSAAWAAAPANDNASNAPYADGWQAGDNGGSGWAGGWLFNVSSANGGFFIFDSTNNGDGADNGNVGGVPGDGDINTAGPAAWGIFANSGAQAHAIRPFSGQLSVGQGFSIDMDNGFIDNGQAIGINLLNSSGASRLTLQFIGGSSTYTVYDTGLHDTLVPYTDEGLRMDMVLTGTDSYSITVTRRDGVTNTLTGTLGGTAGSGLDRVDLVNFNAGFNGSNNLYFNSMVVTPEPAAGLLVAAMSLFVRRGRRN